MTPETKKTLIYGGVISFAVGAGLYVWSRYEGTGNGIDSNAASSAQAQADAQAQEVAAQQETQLAEISALGGGQQLAPESIGSEAPPDNFAQEIAQILQATGLGAPTNSLTTPPANTTSANPPATGTSGAVEISRPVGLDPGVPRNNVAPYQRIASAGSA